MCTLMCVYWVFGVSVLNWCYTILLGAVRDVMYVYIYCVMIGKQQVDMILLSRPVQSVSQLLYTRCTLMCLQSSAHTHNEI